MLHQFMSICSWHVLTTFGFHMSSMTALSMTTPYLIRPSVIQYYWTVGKLSLVMQKASLTFELLLCGFRIPLSWWPVINIMSVTVLRTGQLFPPSMQKAQTACVESWDLSAWDFLLGGKGGIIFANLIAVSYMHQIHLKLSFPNPQAALAICSRIAWQHPSVFGWCKDVEHVKLPGSCC